MISFLIGTKSQQNEEIHLTTNNPLRKILKERKLVNARERERERERELEFISFIIETKTQKNFQLTLFAHK